MFSKIKGKAISKLQGIQTSLGIIEREITYFEGGLGAQIIAYIEYREKMQSIEKGVSKSKLLTDTNYFRKYTPGVYVSGPIIRPWKLDIYNISLESVSAFQASKFRKVIKSRRRSPKTISNITENRWRKNKGLHLKYFPRVLRNEAVFQQIGIDPKGDFSVVHVRRGDFITMGTLSVANDSFINLLSKINMSLTKEVYIVSDSVLENEFKNEILKILKLNEVHWIEGENISEVAVHEFMREAKVLVCSNSMFSFSAGILSREDALVIAPMNFFGGDLHIPNSGKIYSLEFTSAGDFFIFS